MTLPDKFIAHGSPQDQYIDAGLMAENIVATALNMLSVNKADLEYRPDMIGQKIYATP